MTRRFARSAMHRCCIAISLVLLVSPVAALAENADNSFFNDVAGRWQGPGKIIEGKLKGKRFKCTLNGLPAKAPEEGFRLEGSCRAGLLSHKVTAAFLRDGEGYRGHFLDGAEGEGLDVTGGVIKDRTAIIDVEREKVKGAIVTNLMSDEHLNITVMIRGHTKFVPVIGLSLKRQTDNTTVGAIK